VAALGGHGSMAALGGGAAVSQLGDLGWGLTLTPLMVGVPESCKLLC
jgi:hypothetical protein